MRGIQALTLKSVAMTSIATLVLNPIGWSEEMPKHVAGKVVNVSHQQVKVNNTWLDRIEVSVDNCLKPGTLDTVFYDAATVSDRTALGDMFEQDIHSARTADLHQQNLPNGYGVFWVDAQNRVLRTGLLGSKMSCNQVPAVLQQFK